MWAKGGYCSLGMLGDVTEGPSKNVFHQIRTAEDLGSFVDVPNCTYSRSQTQRRQWRNGTVHKMECITVPLALLFIALVRAYTI